MTIKLKNYLIIDNLANGGFGSIYRAIHEKIHTKRLVVVKVIKPEFSEDEKFKNSFISEIKASFPLNHPNIAQLFEYGEKDKRLYYVLEYIEGINLRQLRKKAEKKKMTIPIPAILHMMIESCNGLHFAHNFSDQLTRQKYRIVHRDISPQNIMVSFDGMIKVIDFGIAKARTNMENTQTGIIKGKPAYMAPEYIRSGYYDHRFDQFSLGVVFWELLCNKKLFTGKNSIDILKAIDKCEIPLPRFYNDEVTHELQEIVLKCLNQNYRKRYRNMDELKNALTKVLFKDYGAYSVGEFQSFIRKLCASEVKWEKARLKRLVERAQDKRKEQWDARNMLKKAK